MVAAAFSMVSLTVWWDRAVEAVLGAGEDVFVVNAWLRAGELFVVAECRGFRLVRISVRRSWAWWWLWWLAVSLEEEATETWHSSSVAALSLAVA